MAIKVGPYTIEAVHEDGTWYLEDGSTITKSQRGLSIKNSLAACKSAEEPSVYDQSSKGFAAAQRMLEHQVAVDHLVAAGVL